MKLILALALVSAVSAQQFAQQQRVVKPFVPILAYSNEVSHDGSYAYSYQSADGNAAQENGYVKNRGVKDQEAMVAEGSYSYTAPDGTPITVTYVADEFGFRASGAHLPTPPPIPEAIARSLEFIARSQQAGGAPVNRPVFTQPIRVQANRNTFG